MYSTSRYRLVFALAIALTGAAAAQYAQQQATDSGRQVRVTQGPLIQYADEGLAVVAWATDTATDTRVYYGTDISNLSRVAESNGYGTTHRVNLTSLSPNTTYYFQIDTGEMEPSSAQPMASFHTVMRGAPPVQNQRPQMINPINAATAPGVAGQYGTQPAITRGPIIQFADESSAVITWSTNVPAESTLYYGNTPDNLSLTADAPGPDTTHRVHILSLAPNTTYYFRIQAAPGQRSTPVNSFRTAAAGAAPIYDQAAQTVAPPPSPNPPNRNNRNNNDEGFGQRRPQYSGQGMQVPAGTEIDATLQRALSSKSSRVGEKFTAIVRSPLRDTTGALAITAGSVINGEVTEVVEGKTLPSVRGRGKLNLRFQDITLPDGRVAPLTATLVSMHDRRANEEGQVQSGTKGSTVAKDVGIGAGLGTVAGIILGGAMKGLLIGAVAGGGYVLASGGKNVDIPADSGLKLRLDNNLTVPATRAGRSQSWEDQPEPRR